ncbi:TetR family transcriptional regulator C-terminal domain-containing protein [Nocardia mexicana]|uniref:TetR family transcriptional regulator n=1 Tax=Nocardia mexicana TaxID=279262 RepID=A0A370H2U3_9NOCA|nr:TetR family transcriptional regulator C-terminal domain-containing protein [Nocardia mexicana]RDI50526.1 TetR family transcriptional regulator [Nocardia mexicana]
MGRRPRRRRGPTRPARAVSIGEFADAAIDAQHGTGGVGGLVRGEVDGRLRHLGGGSLYGTFGDKRRFYLDAVRLYWEVYERHLTTALGSDPVLPALREILTHPARLDELISDVGTPRGCMVGNTTAELVPGDADATEVATSCYRRFTEIVADALRRAQATGEVTRTTDPEAQAQLLLYVVQGLSLVSRAGLDKAAALAAIDTAIEALRA